MKKLKALLLASATMLACAAPSYADPVIELGLSIDVSGSISSSNFTLQKNAYINVLNNPAIIPLDGSIAIGVIAFDDTIHPVFSTTVITSATIGSLIQALQTNLLDFAGSTAIGDSINYLSNQLLTNSINSTSQVIDVSTDGDGNTGANQVTASNAAVAAGIEQINCLGIGSGANCNFARGAGSFSETVTSFADFQDSLQRKILRETGSTSPGTGSTSPGTSVPEPAPIAVLSMGLLGFYVFRRRSI